MAQKTAISLFWFRRDLRLVDNHGLYKALTGEHPVLPVFIFDTNILEELEGKNDARVQFIYDQLREMHQALQSKNSGLDVYFGTPLSVFKSLLDKYSIRTVYTNHDYEPYAVKRDQEIKELLRDNNIDFKTYKDQVIFEKDEILNGSADYYKVFTSYKNSWLGHLQAKALLPYTSALQFSNFYQSSPSFPSLESIGFERSVLPIPPATFDEDLIRNYDKTRDNPALATSRLGIHLRHGTISIRKAVKTARELNQIWLNELIWREFFMMILWHKPVVVAEAFNTKYNRIEWRNNEEEFDLWCKGKTGYPIVDAGMRELNKTGFMHNRVRMITASFLTKHLLIDWRWGEAYFAKKLLDYELASNNGNWQWVAGTGVDAQPYFRVFNPYSQAEKFDKQKEYIKQWVPEYESDGYPSPIVDHKAARERALSVFKKAAQG